MAAAPTTITVDLKLGPMLNAVCNLLSIAQECSHIIPEWYPDERKRLEECVEALYHEAIAQLDKKR